MWGHAEVADGFPGALPCAGALGPRRHRGVREKHLLPPLPGTPSAAFMQAAICQAAKNNGYFFEIVGITGPTSFIPK